MDFNQLMMKMRELDQPTTEGGCGMDAPMAPPPLSAVPPKPETPPPSMSVNINAQGMENIEDMMKLFQKVNPDMSPAPMPTMSIMPPIGMDKPMGPPDIKPINKLLPDFDADNDDMPGGEMDSDYDKDGKLDPHEKDHADEKPLLKTLDKDDDGDHDMDDHDLEKKSKDEEYANEPDTDIKDVDYMNNKLAGGMNRPKDTFPKVADGDNPMQKKKFESGDLRAQIRAELLQRLAEAKGAK
jgi:hypothetical protein